MTRKLGMVLALAGVLGVLVLLLRSAPAHATSGPNWKVTVHNTSPYGCAMNIWTVKGLEPYEKEFKYLAAGETYTFQTGARCPTALSGLIEVGGAQWREVRGTCLLTGAHQDPIQCTATCWNSSWTICRKAGTDPAVINNNDFGFCKN